MYAGICIYIDGCVSFIKYIYNEDEHRQVQPRIIIEINQKPAVDKLSGADDISRQKSDQKRVL